MDGVSPYYRQWLHLRLRKWLIHPFCRAVYRDRNHDIGRSMVVAGTGRSGTTWVAKIINSQVSCRVMFEPFHSRYVPDFRDFHYFQYMRPEADNDQLYACCQRLLSGRIRNAWIDREVEVILPQFRLVKEIRMNLFLKWFATRFPEVPLVFVVRHPCAVVLSRMQLGWGSEGDLADFFAQDDLMADFLQDKMGVIESARTPAQRHALIWCISNLVPLRQFTGSEWHLFFYEHLVSQPEVEIPRLFKAIRQEFAPSVFTALERPSSSTTAEGAVMQGRQGTARWKDKLTVRQVDEILAVVAGFGLDYLYGDADSPIFARGRPGQGPAAPR